MTTEPATTVVYRKTTGMSTALLRKDFATEAAADKWLDAQAAADKIELVEVRRYETR